jgi:ribosomal protein S3
VQRNLIENMRQKERSIKLRRLKVLRTFKKYRLITKHKTVKRLSMNSFSNQLLQSLSLFTHERLNIFTTFRQLDRTMKIGLNRSKTKRLKKNVALLRKFNRNDFFKEGINLMYRFAKQPDSSGLLAQFVANVLKKLKRHNFFLRFLRAALVLFSHRDFSKLGGIKIKVKGRFNGAPRARQRTIKIGNLPLLTLDSNVSYAETVSFTSNGTFGVKVWTCAGTI